MIVAGLLWRALFPILQTRELLSDETALRFRIYLRFIIHPINVPAVTPIANVVASVSTG